MNTFCFKKFVGIILAMVMVCITCVSTSYAEQSESACQFKDIEDLRETVQTIYEDNYSEFVELVRSRSNITVKDEEITFYENCGPCTYAFQSILYDNGILAESQKASHTRPHIFNFYRGSFESEKDKVSQVIIDTTYKQFIRQTYLSSGYSFAQMEEDLPKVLVYEFGNKEQLREQLAKIESRFGEEKLNQAVGAVYENQVLYCYQTQDYQSLEYRAYIDYDAKLLDKLRNESGKYQPKLNENLVLNCTSDELTREFVYDTNGIYRCYLTPEETKIFANGFNIVNSDNNVLFGAQNADATLEYIPTFGFVPNGNNVLLMSDKSEESVKIKLPSEPFLPLLVCVDLRAGESNPAIYAFNVTRTLVYGDVDLDMEVSINDATLLQKAIAKNAQVTLDDYQKESANVLKVNPLNIMNATEIQRYLTSYETKYCSDIIYCSNALSVSDSNQFGYVDIQS